MKERSLHSEFLLMPGSISGQTPEEMLELYNAKTHHSEPHATNLMAQAHDAVWAMALALNATETQLIQTGVPLSTLLHEHQTFHLVAILPSNF